MLPAPLQLCLSSQNNRSGVLPPIAKGLRKPAHGVPKPFKLALRPVNGRARVRFVRFSRAGDAPLGGGHGHGGRERDSGLEIDRGFLAALDLDLVADLLTFIQAVESGPLDRADVDEHILAARIGLDESETFGGVEPLDGT